MRLVNDEVFGGLVGLGSDVLLVGLVVLVFDLFLLSSHNLALPYLIVDATVLPI